MLWKYDKEMFSSVALKRSMIRPFKLHLKWALNRGIIRFKSLFGSKVMSILKIFYDLTQNFTLIAKVIFNFLKVIFLVWHLFLFLDFSKLTSVFYHWKWCIFRHEKKTILTKYNVIAFDYSIVKDSNADLTVGNWNFKILP